MPISNKNKKKKILYLITKSNWGGAQRYVYDLATNIPHSDYNVIVAVGGNGILAEKLRQNNIKTISINGLQRNINILEDIKVFFVLYKLFKNEKPNIVHLNSSKIGGLGALAARVARVPRIVFTAHGWAFNEARNVWQMLFIKLLSWFTVFLCHKVITVSEYDGKQGRAMPFVGKKITVIHNGISKIDFKDKSYARNELFKELESPTSVLDKKTIWIGTIAELHKNKGLEYAIKALSLIKQSGGNNNSFIFTIIGEGEEKENLQKLIKKDGIEENVFMAGYKKNAPSLLSAFDVFLLTSTKEGLPYVLLEAGLSKTPVIASDVGGVPEIIDDMETGILVRTKNSDEVAKAIVYFMKNKKKISEFGQKLYNKITKEFSTSKMIQKTTQTYKI